MERLSWLLPGGHGRRQQLLGEDCGARAPQLRGSHPIDGSAMRALLNVWVRNLPMVTTIIVSPRVASQMAPGYILGGPE